MDKLFKTIVFLFACSLTLNVFLGIKLSEPEQLGLDRFVADTAMLQESIALKDEAIAVKDVQIQELTQRVEDVRDIKAKRIIDEDGKTVDLGIESNEPITYTSNGLKCVCN